MIKMKNQNDAFEEKVEDTLELRLTYNKDRLMPVITQDSLTKEILSFDYIGQEALQKTFDTGFATYFSNSRNTIWTKGEISADNLLKIEDIIVNCKQNSVLILVSPAYAGGRNFRIIDGNSPRNFRYYQVLTEGFFENNRIVYDNDMLVPAVTTNFRTGKVLLPGYVNPEALQKTLETGFATYFSRSRNTLWTKGETSGDLLKVNLIQTTDKKDLLFYDVTPLGKGACHVKDSEGNPRESCFYRRIKNNALVFV
jgi:phosphoribosyl-AMP cyclohydrolase